MSLSFGLFMLAASLLLLGVFYTLARQGEEQRLASLADANVAFLERSPLPQSAEMAEQLGGVMGARVLFSHRDLPGEWVGKVEPGLLKTVQAASALAGIQRLPGGYLLAQRDLRSGGRVSFLRVAEAESEVLHKPGTWLSLAVLWLLSLALGGWWAQRLARPVQRLAELLPQVGQDAPLPALPFTQRADEIGHLARALGATHQALVEERLRRREAERLALLGRMATSLAHEVRNPLAAIRLHAQLLEGASEAEAVASLGLIESEISRMEGLVQQWMHYARPAPPKLSEVNLSALVQQALRVIQPQADHAGVRLVEEVEPLAGCKVWADRERLLQVLLNLLLNAIQAMPEGGSVRVAAVAAGVGGAELRVEDSGRGFSPTGLLHAGEPFYSEKEGGMGLGLSVAREIMLAHGGSLRVENVVPVGARVTLGFPLRSPGSESSD